MVSLRGGVVMAAVGLVACEPRRFRVLEVGAPERIEVTTARYVTEIPPWSIEGGAAPWLLLSSSSAGLCDAPTSLATFDGGALEPCSELMNGTLDPAISEAALAQVPAWRRNYAGLFTAHLLPSGDGQRLLAIGHGENKNERIGDRVFLNTINTDVGAECVSQPNPAQNTYDDCWEAYSAFVTVAEAGLDGDGRPLPVEDFGPIAWPANGYTQAGAKASFGLRHPSSLVHDGALYVFYVDESFGEAPERGPGVRVVRAPTTPLPRPGRFTALRGETFTEPALPDGYSPARLLDFVGQQGPASPPLFAEAGVDSVRFSVARVRGTRWFLGVEERTEVDDTWSLAFRLSEDLVHWSQPLFTPALRAASWDAARLNYPVLLDARGQTNTEVDAAGFFVLGTGASVLHRAWVSLELPD